MKRLSFNADWRFSEGGDRFFMFAGGDSGAPVTLPHDYIICKERTPDAVSGASSGFYPGGDGSYTKVFSLTDEMKGKNVLLNIDGAYMNSEVTLNGDLISLHPYGYTAYTVNLTDKLKDTNTLRITTKDTQPNSRWYSGAGLYRCVDLLIGGRKYIHPWDLFITTPEVSTTEAAVNVAFEVSGEQGEYTFTCRILDRGGNEVAAASSNDGKAVLTVASPLLWSVDAPNLYTLEWTLSDESGVTDEGQCRFGIRKIEIDSVNGFRLNGKPMKLRGGCIHHDNAMLGSAALPVAEKRKIRLLKEAGYTAIRCAHNPPSTALLDACDELGMLVLDESFDMWRTGKNAMDYHLWFEDWWQRDTMSMVRRDRNHPCVYAWSIGNEISELLGTSNGAYWAKAQADFVRSMDPTRPVSASANGFVAPKPGKPRKPHDLKAELVGKPVMGLPADGEDDWGDQTLEASKALDIFGYNYMYGRYAYDRNKFPDRVIHATETHSFHTYDYWKACIENPNCIGDFIWTAFDNLGEAGAGRVIYSFDEMKGGLIGSWPWLSCWQGDLDLTGEARPQNWYRRVMWGIDKGIHLFVTPPERTGKPFYGMGWHWEDVNRCWNYGDEWLGKPAKVQAYCDCDEVIFCLNGREISRVKPEEYKAFCEIPYERGIVEVKAVRNGETVASDSIRTTGAPCKLVLAPEKTRINADGMDLCYIRAYVTDSDGSIVRDCCADITVTVTGGAALAGVGSGNPRTEENFTHHRRAYNGSVLIVARAGFEKGTFEVKAEAEGLTGASFSAELI